MSRVIEEGSSLESNTVSIYRSAATMAGGRRFSFGALVVVGDRRGKVSLGYAKANEVPMAIEKAQKNGKRGLKKIVLQGGTIPHAVMGRFGSSQVKLLPASPGTGVVAGSTVRAVLELAGVTDIMTKSYGSNNSKNLAKAVLNGLEQLRPKEYFAELRGVEIGKTEVDERIERGEQFLKKEAPELHEQKKAEEAEQKAEAEASDQKAAEEKTADKTGETGAEQAGADEKTND
jgi:small subunit ribosomal protein S5